MFDSTAMLFALADRYREAGFLAPVGTRERDLAYQWSLTAMTEFENAAIGYLMREDDDWRQLYRSVATAFFARLSARPALARAAQRVESIFEIA